MRLFQLLGFYCGLDGRQKQGWWRGSTEEREDKEYPDEDDFDSWGDWGKDQEHHRGVKRRHEDSSW